ncbi:MAG: YdbL family protein [Proteobacteria bacterium]|nr:YdbL family protein [Pseudomonadota bacterium]
MGSHRKIWPWALAPLALGAACVTVNIYFPAAKVEEAAKQIVEEVYQEKVDKPQTHLGTLPDAGAWTAWLGPRAAHAEDAATVSNAAIRALKDQIAQRHAQLAPHYTQGQVGINRDGYLEVRDTGGLTLPEVATLKRLVEADNAARRQLYVEVARALNLQPQQVNQVQEIFAREWRDKAQAGWWVQDDAGAWRKR